MALHVIIGADDYLVETAAKRIIGNGDGLEVIDSLAASNEELRLRDLAEAESAYFTPPFLYPRKVTWWKNVGFLPASGGGKSASDKDERAEKVSEAVKLAVEKLANRIAETPLPENQEFIISGPRLLPTSRVAKLLKGAGEMIVVASPQPWEQRKLSEARIRERGAELGLKFAPDAVERFVNIVGNDARSQMSELDKLAAYVGPKHGAISVDDVGEIAAEGVGVETSVWEVSDALGDRDLVRLVKAVERFERENGFAIRITNEVEKLFRHLCELKDATAKGMASEALAGFSPFAGKKLSRFLPKWSLNELRVARARFLRLREDCVTTSRSADQMVTVMLMETAKRKVR